MSNHSAIDTATLVADLKKQRAEVRRLRSKLKLGYEHLKRLEDVMSSDKRDLHSAYQEIRLLFEEMESRGVEPDAAP